MGSPFKWNPPALQLSMLHAKDTLILARSLCSEVTGPFFLWPWARWASADWKQSGMCSSDLCCLRKCWHLVRVAAGAISERLHPSLVLPTHCIRPSSGEPPRAVVIATAWACWCPWGSLLDRIPCRLLPAKGRAPSAELLFMFAHV